MNNASYAIKEIGIADFCVDGSTVSTEVLTETLHKKFYIQTVDGEYRSDLGCIIYSDDDDEIDAADYPEIDFDGLISAAEAFIQSDIVEEDTDYVIGNQYVTLLHQDSKVTIVFRNRDYINKYTSTYQRAHSDAIKICDDREAAIRFLESQL